MRPLCKCGLSANFGSVHDMKKLFCSKHKRPGDINLNLKRCVHHNCFQLAVYRNSNGNYYCPKHKEQGSTTIHKKQQCIYEDCEITASYGDPVDRQRLYCAGHKRNGDINLRITTCKYETNDGTICKIEASYGVSGTNVRLFCAGHKSPEHVHLCKKYLCRYEGGCPLRATFGPANGNTRSFCRAHKSPTDISCVMAAKIASAKIASTEAASTEAASTEAASTEAASTEAASTNTTPRKRVRKE